MDPTHDGHRRGPVERPFKEPRRGNDASTIWRGANEIVLADAPKGAPKYLLHVRFPDSAALTQSCLYRDHLVGLALTAKGPSTGDIVELVVTIDAGSVKLWCARGMVVRRRLLRQDVGEIDVEFLPEFSEAATLLDSVVLGVAPAKLDRTEERTPAKLRATVDIKGERVKLVSTDLSPNGVALASKTPPAVGTPVELEIRAGLFSKPVKVRGVVCWEKNRRGFGVKFLFDHVDQRHAVLDLVKSAA